MSNAITPKGLADDVDATDSAIADLNAHKSDTYKAYKSQLEEGGMDPRRASAEVAALKAAIARRRKLLADPEAVSAKDELIDGFLAEIMPASCAREEA